MKRLLLALLLSSSLILSSCSQENEDIKDEQTGITGDFSGSATGFGGTLNLNVTLTNGIITNVEILDNKETPNIAAVALETLPTTIVEANSINVDTVASATVTSKAILSAVEEALLSAGVDPSTLVKNETEEIVKTAKTVDADVVIIGAGGAGMTSAIKLHEAGLNVVIIEKMPMVGGNTVKATGGMNAAETTLQAELGISDTVEQFVEDTLKGGYYVNDVELVTVMAEKSAAAVDWLAEIGAPLADVTFSGGATNERIHKVEGGAPIGDYLVSTFSNQLKDLEIPVYYNTEATELIKENGVITGVIANSKEHDYTFNGKAVLLATGGFGANEEMFTEYRPDLEGFVTTNTPAATGDGITMALEVGASLTDIEQIQIHPTVVQSNSLMITESVRGEGAILVNTDGERFTNELLTRDVVSANILAQENGYAYLIFDDALRGRLSAVEKYVAAGVVETADSISALASKIGVDSSVLDSTVTTWNESVKNQNDAEFTRTTGMEYDITTGPFYAIQIAPGVHHTMGGVTINTDTNVLDTEGNIIPGLYAAGEVVGGIHGGNRIGGTAVTDIIVFGIISAETIVEYIEN